MESSKKFPFSEGLKEYFSKFGEIAEVMVMKDPTTRRSRYRKKLFVPCIVYCIFHKKEILNIFRGFGFVTFADVKGVDNVLAQGSHDLDGKKVRQNPFISFDNSIK